MRQLALLTVFLLLLVTSVSAGAQTQDEVDDINDEIAELEALRKSIGAEKQAAQIEVEEAAAVATAAQAEVAAAQAKVDAVSAEIVSNEVELEEIEVRLDRLLIEIANTRLEIREARNTFQEGAAELYMQRAAGIGGSLVVNVDDMAQVSVAIRYSDDVFDSSERLLNTLEILERLEENQQLAIETNQARVLSILADLEVKRAALVEDKIALEAAAQVAETLLANAKALLAEITSEIAEIDGEISSLEADAAAITEEINRLARNDGTNPGILAWPVNGTLTSGFGYRIHPISGVSKLHTGIDVSAPSGTTLYAAGSGTVILASWYGGYGNTVIIDHGGGLTTLYAHQSSIAVGVGASVNSQTVIGYVGTTGYSTGPHLHFETREWGAPVNPMKYLN